MVHICQSGAEIGRFQLTLWGIPTQLLTISSGMTSPTRSKFALKPPGWAALYAPGGAILTRSEFVLLPPGWATRYVSGGAGRRDNRFMLIKEFPMEPAE